MRGGHPRSAADWPPLSFPACHCCSWRWANPWPRTRSARHTARMPIPRSTVCRCLRRRLLRWREGRPSSSLTPARSDSRSRATGECAGGWRSTWPASPSRPRWVPITPSWPGPRPPDLDPMIPLGAVGNGHTVTRAIALERFIIMVSAERSRQVESRGGPLLLRGSSPSQLMAPHGVTNLPPAGLAVHEHTRSGWTMPPMHPTAKPDAVRSGAVQSRCYPLPAALPLEVDAGRVTQSDLPAGRWGYPHPDRRQGQPGSPRT